MIRLMLIAALFYSGLAIGQLHRPTKKELLSAIKDSLPADSWQICNTGNSFYTKDTLCLYKMVLNSSGHIDLNNQYYNCCKVMRWHFIGKKTMFQCEEEWCTTQLKTGDIYAEDIKIKIAEEDGKTILKRYWHKKLLDSYYIIDLANVTLSNNQKTKAITMVRIK